MSFRFPLATVLRVRESVERREEIALQKIQKEIACVRQGIEEAVADIANRHELLAAHLMKPLPAGQMQFILAEISASVERKNNLQTALEELLRRQREQLNAYRAAHQARQTLTNMRTEQRMQYDQRQERMLQKFLDDIFASQSHRS